MCAELWPRAAREGCAVGAVRVLRHGSQGPWGAVKTKATMRGVTRAGRRQWQCSHLVLFILFTTFW